MASLDRGVPFNHQAETLPRNSNGGYYHDPHQPEKGALVRVGPIPTGRTDVACNQAYSG